MSEFYRHLQQNPDKAQALRSAMLTIMKQRPEPKNWAAFTLIGEANWAVYATALKKHGHLTRFTAIEKSTQTLKHFRCGAKFSNLLRCGITGKKVEDVTVDMGW